MTLRAGTYLQGRYEILSKIGSGGMSDVYKAKDHKLNRNIAIKVLKDEFSSDENFVKKFRMEAQAAAGLTHENIVGIYDVIDEDNLHYIVMELIEGSTLKELIKENGKLDIESSLTIAIMIASGISAAHSKHLIHRDIKPQNVIMSKDGKAKVADFGIARAASSQTLSSTAMGSVHYISPEQARGDSSDERSDIYSLGITLYEMVTGRVPFDGDNTVAIALAQLDETMTPPSEYNPEIPTELDQIILTCCQKKPERRYQNIDDVITDMRRVLVSLKNGTEIPLVSNIGLNTDTVVLKGEDLSKIQAASKRNSLDKRGAKHIDDDDDDETSPKMEKIFSIAGIIIAVAIVLILIAVFAKVGGLFTLGSKPNNDPSTEAESTLDDTQVYMPDVVDMSQDLAEQKLKESFIQMKIVSSEYSDTVDKDKIISQDPLPDTVVSKYGYANVVVSLGTDKIDLTQLGIDTMSLSDAQQVLRDQGLVVGTPIEEFSETIEAGNVISYTPTSAAKGSTITITVSKGKEQQLVKAPALVGQTEDVALGLLTDLGLLPGTVKTQYSDSVTKGVIITQDVAPDSDIAVGSTLGYTISDGPEPKNYKYVASIDATYNLTDLIGPGSSNTSVDIMVRLKQTVHGEVVYKTLMEPRTVTGDTILPVRFKSIEGADGVDRGEVEVVESGSGSVLKSYTVEFFKVE